MRKFASLDIGLFRRRRRTAEHGIAMRMAAERGNHIADLAGLVPQRAIHRPQRLGRLGGDRFAFSLRATSVAEA